MITFINGYFKEDKNLEEIALSDGFLSGFGIFETMRSYKGNIVYFNQHIERFKKSSVILGLDLKYTCRQLRELIKDVVSENNISDACVRINLSKKDKGSNIVIIAKKYNPYPAAKFIKGFSAGISKLRVDAGGLLPGIKTTNRIIYDLSLQEARKKGFDEALILNNKGNVCEGSRTNIFLVKDREIFTPELGCGCLPGITRSVIFDIAEKAGININQSRFSVHDLYKAEEAFLTNSLIGIMPLTSIEGNIIGDGKCAGITKLLIRKYSFLLK